MVWLVRPKSIKQSNTEYMIVSGNYPHWKIVADNLTFDKAVRYCKKRIKKDVYAVRALNMLNYLIAEDRK